MTHFGKQTFNTADAIAKILQESRNISMFMQYLEQKWFAALLLLIIQLIIAHGHALPNLVKGWRLENLTNFHNSHV